MKNTFYLFIILFLFNYSCKLFSQTESGRYLLPDGLSLSNQLEYSYNVDDKTEIFENWLTIDYRKSIFNAGIRFEVFQPNDPDPSINRGKLKYADIAFKYIDVEIGDVEEGLDITVGNYYKLFGRGLVLKSYEDRNIRIDNNLIGVKVEAVYKGFILNALSGSAANSINERKDILHALDFEYVDLDVIKLAGTFASNQSEYENTPNTTLASFRIQPSIWNFDAYFEYGIKNKEVKIGEAYYGNINFYYGSFSAVGEYKFYDNYAFTSSDGTIFYNTPPSLRKEYTYQLLNRHPSPLDQSNESGFSFELNYSLSEQTSLSANYGVTKTLSAESYYQKQNSLDLPSTTQLKEIYFQTTHSWNESLTSILAFGYNEELSTGTKNFTPILENKFYFNEINTVKIILEHQQTEDISTDEKYYNDVISIEYLRSPRYSAAVVTEIQTKEPEAGNIVRKVWSYIQLGYKFAEHTDLSLLVGSRQAGNICIGGICRYEPAFQGIELKMLTRL